MGAYNAINLLVETELHRIATVPQGGRKLIQPLVTASIRTASRRHVEGHPGDRFSLAKKPAHSGKNSATGTVISGPRM